MSATLVSGNSDQNYICSICHEKDMKDMNVCISEEGKTYSQHTECVRKVFQERIQYSNFQNTPYSQVSLQDRRITNVETIYHPNIPAICAAVWFVAGAAMFSYVRPEDGLGSALLGGVLGVSIYLGGEIISYIKETSE